MNQFVRHLSADDFWLLMAKSGPAPVWPQRFSATWPDPREDRQGVEYPVRAAVLNVEGKLSRLPGETPWIELRQIRLAINARDYSRYRFELLVIPIPPSIFSLFRDVADDVEIDMMGWEAPSFCVVFRPIRLSARRVGSVVWGVADWGLDGQTDTGFKYPQGHEPTEKEKAQADHARQLFGQLVRNMTRSGAPTGNTNHQRYPKEDPQKFNQDLSVAIDAAICELVGRRNIARNDIPEKIGVKTIARHWPGGIDRETLGREFKERGFNVEATARRRLPRALELNSAPTLGRNGAHTVASE